MWVHRLLGKLEAHESVALGLVLLEVWRRHQWVHIRIETELKQVASLYSLGPTSPSPRQRTKLVMWDTEGQQISGSGNKGGVFSNGQGTAVGAGFGGVQPSGCGGVGADFTGERVGSNRHGYVQPAELPSPLHQQDQQQQQQEQPQQCWLQSPMHSSMSSQSLEVALSPPEVKIDSKASVPGGQTLSHTHTHMRHLHSHGPLKPMGPLRPIEVPTCDMEKELMKESKPSRVSPSYLE